MKPSDFFTPAQKTAMVAAIRQAEKDTSGEIRIHFENHCRKNVLDRAAQVFADLKMHKTALRNGVLIYVALEDKQLAILGDAGINAKVPDHFWDDIKNNMIEKFKSGQICEGVCEAVLTAGQQLKVFFPYQADDVNELSDDISFKCFKIFFSTKHLFQSLFSLYALLPFYRLRIYPNRCAPNG